MNIFAIDRDPVIAAQHLVDTHVSKMVLESAQMLATCFTLERLAEEDCPRTQKGTPRIHGYYNHPCSKWVRISKKNMAWLGAHAIAMDLERIARAFIKKLNNEQLMKDGKPYDKALAKSTPMPHHSLSFIYWVLSHLDESVVPEGELTEFAQAMPDEFKCADSVEAYRKFYQDGKAHLHVWTRNKPEWLNK